MKNFGETNFSLINIMRVIFPALAVLIALLSTGYLTSVDRNLFAIIGFARHGQFKTDIFALIPAVVLAALLSSEAALRVKPKYLPLVFIQTTAVSLFLSWLTWKWSGSFSLSAALIASSLTFTLGLVARRLKRADEIERSRYFELVLKNDELNQTRLALLKQDEADRRILASDLHDQVLNEIKTIKSKVQQYDDQNDDNKTDLRAIETSLDRVALHIRNVMENLFPSVLENLGLCAALDQLTRELAQKGALQGRFIKNIEDDQVNLLNKTEQLLLFRLTQEALNNVVKHSQAKIVKVTLNGSGAKIVLSIADDGIGFQEKERGDSRGLRYMRLRADLIGAKINWNTGQLLPDSKGTTVNIELAKVILLKEQP